MTEGGSGRPGDGRYGDDASGSSPRGDIPRGDIPRGDTPRGDAPHGDTPHGGTPAEGTPPRGSASDGPRSGEPASGGAPGDAAEGPTGGEGDDPSPDNPSPDEPLASEEQAIRRLLQDSVRDLQPSEETLDHLRRAVPARRTHRRQALVGITAAALIAVVGIPTLLYGGVVPGVGDDKHPLTASSTHGQTHGPDGGTGAQDGEGADRTGKDGKGDGEDKGGKGEGSTAPSPSGGPGDDTADPSETLTASAPTCGRDQLGKGTAQTGSPDGQGRVYGSFRVTNTSGDACTVEGEGMLGADTQGGTARARVAIMDHTPGDPAPGLGDPAAASDELVLKPGASYLVKFAWVPSDSGSGCSSGTPSPNTNLTSNEPPPNTGSDSGGDDGGGADSGGGSGGTGTLPGDGNSGSGDPGDGPGESSVVLSHTPEVGSPAVADTKLDGACGGTVYRTGVLPAS